MTGETETHVGSRTQILTYSPESMAFSGYASFFDVPDNGGDIVARGAFEKSLKTQDSKLRVLWQHDPDQPIGLIEKAEENDLGLFVEGRLIPEVGRAVEIGALIKTGIVDGLSIGYRTRSSASLGGGRRRLDVVDLWEVSIVTFPLFDKARAV